MMMENLNELRPRMMSVAYRMLGSVADAEDAVQDAYLRLHTAESVASPEGFLIRTTTRRCIDQVRRSRMKAVSLDDAGELHAVDRNADPFLDRRLAQSIQELPDVQRALVTLRYQEDLDPSEICRIVNMPVNTVKSHLHRALQSLRKKLEKHL